MKGIKIIIIIVIIIVMRNSAGLLIYSSLIYSNAKQCWFADDATGVGLIEELKEW